MQSLHKELELTDVRLIKLNDDLFAYTRLTDQAFSRSLNKDVDTAKTPKLGLKLQLDPGPLAGIPENVRYKKNLTPSRKQSFFQLSID